MKRTPCDSAKSPLHLRPSGSGLRADSISNRALSAPENQKETAALSVVTTVKNEEKAIESFLDALERQTVRPAEVIIVDDESTDRTKAIINDFANRDKKIRMVSTPCNRSQGRNLGTRLATHDIIVCIDVGCIPDDDCIQVFYSFFCENPDISVAAGAVRSAPQNLFEELTGLLLPKDPTRQSIASGVWLPTSRLIAFRRNFFKSLGGYPEHASYCGEDMRFARRLQESGARIEFLSDAVAKWRPRPTWASFFLQYYRYAYGDGADLLISWKYSIKLAVYLTGLCLLLAGCYIQELWYVFAALATAYIGQVVYRFWTMRPAVTTALLMPIVELYNDIADITGYISGFVVRLSMTKTSGSS